MAEYELVGEQRTVFGSAATRRLRKTGKVPAILFGGADEPMPFALNSHEVKKHLENEAFSSHILRVKVGELNVQAVLKAVQRDPVTSDVTHMDLQRVSASTEITMHVPLHFINEELCLGAKAGGIITHQVVEVDIRCLPKDLPEYIAVDMQMVDLGETIHLSELVMPEGVQATALMHGGEDDQGHDPSLVSVQLAREEAEAVEGEEAEFDEEVTKLVESGGEEGS
jgi:large subunit ribosomal protein L25